jgi:integrase
MPLNGEAHGRAPGRDIQRGIAVTPQSDRVTFDEAAADLLNDYQINGKRSEDVARRRVEKHLTPFFTGARLANITTDKVRAYIAHRQVQGIVRANGARLRDVSNAEINRELSLLRRMFTLAVQAGKLFQKPHIPMLAESAARAGFFEPEQLASVLRHLPVEIRPVIAFAAETGWRIASEILPLQWRQVDFDAGEVRLHAGTTKNKERPRVSVYSGTPIDP